MKGFKVDLEAFIKDVYEIDMEKLREGLYAELDTSWLELEKEDITFANDIVAKMNIIAEEEDIKTTMLRAKEESYIVGYSHSYIDKYEGMLEEKILKDFENLQKLFSEELIELGIVGEFKVKVDWMKNTLSFNGKLKALEAIVVEVINSYGIFGFNSIDEFKNSVCGSIDKRIVSHIHWLRETENIYGTVYDLFNFNDEYVDYYGTLSYDSDISEEGFLDYLEMC